MAKKKVFGKKAEQQSSGDRKKAKVIVSTKLGNNKYAYKEAIVDQDNVRDYINENKS